MRNDAEPLHLISNAAIVKTLISNQHWFPHYFNFKRISFASLTSEKLGSSARVFSIPSLQVLYPHSYNKLRGDIKCRDLSIEFLVI